MKALRKKYGKRPWIDTPNADWYRSHQSSVKAMRAIMLNAIAYQSYAQAQAIRSTTAVGAIEQAKKTAAMADCVINSTKAINGVFERFPEPSPNPSSQKLDTTQNTE